MPAPVSTMIRFELSMRETASEIVLCCGSFSLRCSLAHRAQSKDLANTSTVNSLSRYRHSKEVQQRLWALTSKFWTLWNVKVKAQRKGRKTRHTRQIPKANSNLTTGMFCTKTYSRMNELIPGHGESLRHEVAGEALTAFLEMVHHFPNFVLGPSLYS